MRVIHAVLLLIAVFGSPGIAAADLRLIMVEQPGCIYCRAWDDEISAIYPLTDEGKAAPLTRIQLREPVPDDVSFTRPAAFTPTFVLLDDGVEIGRIEGYPGQDFFWGLLGRMVEAQNPGTGAD